MRRILGILLAMCFWSLTEGCVFSHDTDCRNDDDCDTGHTCQSGSCVDGTNHGSQGAGAGPSEGSGGSSTGSGGSSTYDPCSACYDACAGIQGCSCCHECGVPCYN